MKNNKLLIATLVFFLLINTTYFWEWRSDFLSASAFILMVVGYIILPLVLIFQIILTIREKFKVRRRIILNTIIIIVLLFTYWKPKGLINFEKWEGADLLVAEREGAVDCFTSLKLKVNNKLIERSVCFGIGKTTGDYFIKNDTIFFSNINTGGNYKYYQFAIIRKTESQNEKIIGDLVLYNDIADKDPHRLWIIKNELNK